MDEILIISGIAILISSVFGTIGFMEYKSEQQTLQCIQQVHDKPAIEINAICNK